MSKFPTLNELRTEARRVYGDDAVLEVFDRRAAARDELTVLLESRRGIEFFGRSKAAARRLALETLRALPSKETP